MKKIISYLIVLIMLVPCIVLADYKYADGVIKTDTYIFTYSDYARYIKIREGIPYGFNNGAAVSATSFKFGGFITRPEYDITNSGPSVSWLAPGIEYWLIGKDKLDTKISTGTDEDKSGVRITEYVLHNTKVKGTGTITDPWTFRDGYNVTVGVTDKTIGQISPEHGYEHVETSEGAKEFILTYDNKYEIDAKACENEASSTGATFSIVNGSSSNTKKITINNISKDFSCFINFGTNCYAITLNNNSGTTTNGLHNKTIYYQYGKGWFDDNICKTPLSLTITSPTRVGYNYQGYKYKINANEYGKLIINTSNKIVPGVKDSDVQTDTAYAHWIPIEYNITYDYNNGAGASGGSYPSKGTYDKVIEVTPPTRTGYTFAGWTATDLTTSTAKYGTTNNPSTAWNGTTKVTSRYFKNLRSTAGTVKLTANWTANTYIVAYELNGGSYGTNHPTTGTYDTAFTVNNPTKTGYTFTGWKITGMDSVTHTYGSNTTTNTSIDSTKETSFKNLRSTSGTVTFTALWSANTYTVAYTLNSGTAGTNKPESGTYDSVLTIDNPTRTGYTFAGWTAANLTTSTAKYGTTNNPATAWSNGSTKVTAKYFKNLRSTSGTVTLTANWNINKYTISYNLDGGSYGTNHPTEGTYNSAFTVNNPTKTGYTFTGWKITGMDSITHTYGSSTTTSTSISSTKATSFKNLRATPGTVTFTALWSANTYTLAYTLNSGTAGTNKPTSGTYDSVLTIDNPTRTGYTFAGWTAANLTTSTAKYGTTNNPATAWSNGSTKVTAKYFKNLRSTSGTVTLTASWTANTYTVTYNLNGGSYGTNHPTSATYDSAFTVNKPTKTGYTFAGWNITGMDSVTHTYGSSTTTNTSINGTTATSFKNLRGTSGTVTFTAQWTANTYTISYSLGGGSYGTNHPTTGTYDSAFTVNNPTRTNYIFTGWKITGMDSVTHTYGSSTTTSTSISSTKATSFKNLRSTSGTVTFTAQWVDRCSSVTTTYGSWGSYGSCSASCGGGTQYRYRSWSKTSNYDGGSCGTGTESQSRSCNTQSCCTPQQVIPWQCCTSACQWYCCPSGSNLHSDGTCWYEC